MILNEFFNLPQVFEKDMSEGSEWPNFGSRYAEQLAQKVFDQNPNLSTSGRADELLNVAFPIMVQDLGSRKRANYYLNYDEDFPSDFVSAYGWLQDGIAEGVAEGSNNAERKIARTQALIQDYYNRSRQTKNDIKRDHYIDMARQLEYELEGLIHDARNAEQDSWEVERHDAEPSATWNRGGLAEGVNPIGARIKAAYQKIYNAGDDAIEFAYNDSPIFAQYWDEYEGDLDSIIAEVDLGELQIILDELEAAAEDQGVAEGWKDKLGAAALVAAPIIGGIGANMIAPNTSIQGHQAQLATSSTIPDNAKLVTDDKGNKVYVWTVTATQPKSAGNHKELVYRPAEQVKEQGVAEGVQDSLELQDAAKVLRHYGATNLKTTSNELHFYKNGRPFSVDLIFNPDATRSVSLSQLNSATRKLKGQGIAEGKAMIRKVVRELPSGGKSETYELLNDKGVTLKTGMSKETAQSALKAHKQKTLGESRRALLKKILES